MKHSFFKSKLLLALFVGHQLHPTLNPWEINSASAEPTQLVNNISRRFFMISLLGKPIEYIIRSKIEPTPQDIALSSYTFHNSLIIKEIEQAQNAHARISLHHLWNKFRRFKSFEDTTLATEIAILICLSFTQANPELKIAPITSPLKLHLLLDKIRHLYEQCVYDTPMPYRPLYEKNFSINNFGMVTSIFRFYLINRMNKIITIIRTLPLINGDHTVNNKLLSIITHTQFHHPDIQSCFEYVCTQNNHEPYLHLVDRFTTMYYIQDILFVKEFIQLTNMLIITFIIHSFFPQRIPKTLLLELTERLKDIKNNSLEKNLNLSDWLLNLYFMYKQRLITQTEIA